jgi:cytochrome P450
LTYLFWELAKSPDIQESLYSEIKALDTVAFTDLANLQFLDAVTNEILRVHAAAPASLSRISPEEGGLVGRMFVPAGVCLFSVQFRVNAQY